MHLAPVKGLGEEGVDQTAEGGAVGPRGRVVRHVDTVRPQTSLKVIFQVERAKPQG